MPADFYQVLGVSKSASEEEIRRAYKRIAKENHPDLHPNDAAASERFKQANEAYEVLGDKEKRQQYDQFGPAWKQAGGGGGGPFRGGGGQPVDIDLGNIFGAGTGVDLEELLGGAFGGRGRRGGRSSRSRSSPGEDLQAEVTVPFDLAANGGEYDLHLSRDGTDETLTVKIPAGIRDGGAIRLAGQGGAGIGGGPAGDLRVTVHVAAHPYFRREGNDLLVDVPLTITEAALGARVDVPTLKDGIVTVTIPPGTSSGMRLRLTGKGFVDPKSKARGDQFAVIKIVAPRKPSAEAERLLKELSSELTERPREGLW
jgi:curved DNA-binding protein